MKNLLKKFEIEKLLAVAMAVLSCVCMWGCSEDRVRWNEGFSGAEIVGFVDDSLVMVGSYQMRTESHEGLFEPYWDVIESGHERLCVYNYRVQEDGPRWCDTLGEYNMTNAFRGQMTDSIIWGGDMPNSIRLWKIGESQHQIKLKKLTEGCSGEFGVASVKQWLDGKFIARGDKSLNANDYGCQYAVLDTIARTLTFKRLSDDLEWIRECDDVRAWGKDVYCLWKNNEKTGFFLGINGQKKDSVYVVNVPNISDLWNSFEFCFMGKMLYFGHNINSVDFDNGQIIIYPNVKASSAFNYVDENDNNVNYEFFRE